MKTFLKILPFFSFIFFVAFSSCENGLAFKKDLTFSDRIEEDLSLEKAKELANTVALSSEQLKTWFPNEIGDFTRISFIHGKRDSNNFNSISGKFTATRNPKKHIELNVIDGASVEGTLFILVFKAKFNDDFQEESSEGYARSIQKGNLKALVRYNSKLNTSELEYLLDERFYMQIKGKNTSPEELWDFMADIKPDNLIALEKPKVFRD